MISKKTTVLLIMVAVLLAAYFLGPHPDRPSYNYDLPTVPSDPAALERHIQLNESKHKLKFNNEARIIWADSSLTKTEYAVVYLHGFSASQMEGDPVHRDFAKYFGCNLFLSRLADHGIDTVEALLNFSAIRFWNSAKEALAIGNQLGEKVIFISTSTGGTVALMLAAQFPDQVHALINLSPNVALRDPAAFLLNNPWGLQIARTVLGGNYREWLGDSDRIKYWNNKYRIESLVQLEELIETTMTPETFAKIQQPVLSLYYYKNEAEQDPEVSVAAILEMHKQLSTPASMQEAIAMPNAGAHVLASPLASKDVEGVYKQMIKFAEDKLSMRKKFQK